MDTQRDETYIKDQLLRIVSSTIARLEAASPELRPLIAGQASPMGEVYSSRYLHDAERLVSGYMEQLSRLTGSGSGRGDEIKRITDLIQRRYKENLKLGTLAEIFLTTIVPIWAKCSKKPGGRALQHVSG
ncbi:hypothetical protein ACFSQ7_07575 [Paenibacillus rhizoplanae]